MILAPGGRDWRIFGAGGPAILVYLVSFQPMGDTVS